MNDTLHHDYPNCVKVEDIQFSLAPLDRIEFVDVLTLDTDELVVLAIDQQMEIRALRECYHGAVGLVHRQQQRLDRALRIIKQQQRIGQSRRQDRA